MNLGHPDIISGHELSSKVLLQELNDQELDNVCATNKEMRRICDSPDFWRERIRRYFPGYKDIVIPRFVHPKYVCRLLGLLLDLAEETTAESDNEWLVMKKIAKYLSFVDSLSDNPEVFKYLYDSLFPDAPLGYLGVYPNDVLLLQVLERWSLIYALKRGSLERAFDLDYGHNEISNYIAFAAPKLFSKFLDLITKDERFETDKDKLFESCANLPDNLFFIFIQNDQARKYLFSNILFIYDAIALFHGSSIKQYLTAKLIMRLEFEFIERVTSVVNRDYRYLKGKEQGADVVLNFLIDLVGSRFRMDMLYIYFKASFTLPVFNPSFAVSAFYQLASKGIFVTKIDYSDDVDWQNFWAEYCYRFGKLDLLPFEFEMRLASEE
ncbi:MAG: hypothetical protein Solivirus2_24 [Solivirus sp.]|uniref:F-box domain-containing protein n=1 Tax=Solivirus sp. TaxID=2487772 RepID=A0A3G5AJD6_9VIRU|nr:MAG: hypothetical protein Solivirus2_24 [Solivirus sp.]